MNLLLKPGYNNMNFPHMVSQVFGKWTNPATDEEIIGHSKLTFQK